jgi:cell division control protein 6
VDVAEHRLEVDKTTELINALATQQRLALQACYGVLKNRTGKVSTGQAYELYKSLCHSQGYRLLTQRRFCDMISFLDLYGLINARVVSMGRYGKTREIMSSLPDQVIKAFI